MSEFKMFCGLKIKDRQGQEKIDTNYTFIEPSLRYLETVCPKRGFFDWTVALSIRTPVKQVDGLHLTSEENKQHPLQKGEKELREAVVLYFKRCGIRWCEDKHIFVNTSVFTIIDTFYSLVQWTADQSVLIPAPTFGYYVTQCYKKGITTEIFETSEECGYKIDPKKLDEYLDIHNNVKVFLFNNPVNPTGVVYNRQEVEKIAAVLKKHNIFVISDEVFYDLAFDPTNQPYSIAAVEGMEDNVLTLNGVGKTKGLSSSCVSFACMPEELAKQFNDALESMSMTGLSSLEAQKKAALAIAPKEFNEDYRLDCIEAQQENIQFIQKKLDELNDRLSVAYNKQKRVAESSQEQTQDPKQEKIVKPMIVPQSTNVMMLSFVGIRGKFFGQKQLNTGLELAYLLKDEAGVAMVPGEAFFVKEEKMCLRMSTSYSYDEITKGFEKIERVLERLTLTPQPVAAQDRGQQ